jgi:lysozyme family protein
VGLGNDPEAEQPGWDGVLERGARGPEVEVLQRALVAAGHEVAVDGRYGKGTERAVRAFQEEHGCRVDGAAGPATLTAIQAARGEGATAPASTVEESESEAEQTSPAETVEEREVESDDAEMDEQDLMDTIFGYARSVAQLLGSTGGSEEDSGQQEVAPAADGHIQEAAARAAEDVIPDAPASGTSDGTKDWISDIGAVVDIMPPDLEKAYERCVSRAREGRLSFPGKSEFAKENSGPYKRFISRYKKWMAEEFGQEEHRINKEIINLGGSKARALNIRKYIEGRLTKVPEEYAGKGGLELLDRAAASLEEMGEAASADGVSLQVLSAYRKPKNKKPKNTAAVAANSSHSYGLAVDFELSDKEQGFRVSEIKTGDAKNLMKMFGSSAHKWVVANGARFDWHPYANEPWHFEYNPDGMAGEIVDGALS